MPLFVPDTPCKQCWEKTAEFEVGFGKHSTDTCAEKVCLRTAIYGAWSFANGKTVFVRPIFGQTAIPFFDAEKND